MNQIILVDENDQQVGTCEKLAAHKQGLLHRAFSVFVFRSNNEQTEVLLQQRAQSKYHSAGLWSNTCCSHPQPRETVLSAAYRRMLEEFGFNVPLKTAGSFIYKAELEGGLVEYEYDHILVGVYHDETILPNLDEIAAYKWVELTELMKSLNETPKHYSAWLKEAFALALEEKSHIINELINELKN